MQIVEQQVVQLFCTTSDRASALVQWEIAGSNPTRAFKFAKKPHSLVKIQYCGEHWWQVSASDRQGANFEWRAMSSHSSHLPQKIILDQFSLY